MSLPTVSPQIKSTLVEYAVIIAVLALMFVIGCEYGKMSHVAETASIGTVQQTESWHADTNEIPVPTTEHGSFRSKGIPLANGTIEFHASIPTEHGEATVDQTYDPSDTTLSGKLIAIITLKVPEIILTHSVQSYIPIQTPIASTSDGWTWGEVGAVIGSLFTFAVLLFLHVHL